jgi:hypothetical protein
LFSSCFPQSVDDQVTMYLNLTTQLIVGMLVEFIAVAVFNPAFFAIGIAVFLMGSYCGRIYIKAQLPVKREMSNAKAPILGQ